MSNRNIVVDRLRALAMLGVIGIHIGPFVFASSQLLFHFGFRAVL